MAMTRCKADLHFYDKDKHTFCPYCERLKVDKRPAHGPSEKAKVDDTCSAPTIMIDSEKKRPLTVECPPGANHATTQVLKEPAAESPGEQFAQTELFTGGSTSKTPNEIKQSPSEESLDEQFAQTELFAPGLSPGSLRESAPDASSDEQSAQTELITAAPTPSLAKDSAPTESPGGRPAALEAACAAPESAPDINKVTVMLVEENKPLSPVVGWLVCTEGLEKGRDYRIKAGINEIARDEDPEVDIVIKGDNLVSRRYHAEIQYDSEDNVFYLIQKKHEAVKINDVKVKRPTKLSPYDILQLGETRLVFVPLCSEKFQWMTDS